MRLWHWALLPHLDNQRILGQHRECCALRGNGWGKKHSTVDYVFTHDPITLVYYHWEVMDDMHRRKLDPDPDWSNPLYRGKNCKKWRPADIGKDSIRYPEHNHEYLLECLENLQKKGALRESGKYYRIGDWKAFRKEELYGSNNLQSR